MVTCKNKVWLGKNWWIFAIKKFIKFKPAPNFPSIWYSSKLQQTFCYICNNLFTQLLEKHAKKLSHSCLKHCQEILSYYCYKHKYTLENRAHWKIEKQNAKKFYTLSSHRSTHVPMWYCPCSNYDYNNLKGRITCTLNDKGELIHESSKVLTQWQKLGCMRLHTVIHLSMSSPTSSLGPHTPRTFTSTPPGFFKAEIYYGKANSK